MSFRTDNRGQSITVIKAIATFILFAGFYGIFMEPVSKMLTASQGLTSTTQATTGRSYVAAMWDWLPLAVLGLLLLWVIAASIRQSGGGL